ncbi:deoxyhypusine synthase [candidate division KSB1 bacterium]
MPDKLENFKRLIPGKITGSVKELIENSFLAYNSARFRESCRLFVDKLSKENVTIGFTAAGALTPAGLGASCLVPLMKMGLMDWAVMTGANLYHDLHFALGQKLFMGSHTLDDTDLKKNNIVRIYDILFKNDVLFEADSYSKDFCSALGDIKKIGSAEFHYLLGQKLLKDYGKFKENSILMTAAELSIPLFTSSPGDSTLGMNMSVLTLEDKELNFDTVLDVNQTSAIVYNVKKCGGHSGIVMLGGGSPKNFALQTEPYVQEILNLPEKGHDYFIQFTDARPDTGGLSGATPSEAVSWGKIDPEKLPDSVVCYGDTTVYLPLLTAYINESEIKKEPKRLYDRLDPLLEILKKDYRNNL